MVRGRDVGKGRRKWRRESGRCEDDGIVGRFVSVGGRESIIDAGGEGGCDVGGLANLRGSEYTLLAVYSYCSCISYKKRKRGKQRKRIHLSQTCKEGTDKG